jgi:sulfur relay (sulfurtransferase) DsrC/TusE family protein
MEVKIKKLTEENKAFLSERNLKLKDVARFLKMKESSLINSTAKNRYIEFLRSFYSHIKKMELNQE